MHTPLSSRAGRLGLTVIPALGGRVLQWTFGGRELLASEDAHPDNWGATYWTSPQADWGWPPVVEVDSAPYALLEPSQPGELFLRSAPARIGSRSFRIEKRFTPRSRECIDTEYRIVNLGEAPLRLASWEISRVPPGGLTFFPSGQRLLTPIAPHADLRFDEEAGVSFYDHGAFRPGLSRKAHADGREGFLAHLLLGPEEEDDLLLLKIFEDSPPERQAPGEGEIEVFANFDGRYVEVEVQGPYEAIASGRSSSFVVRTTVVPVPVGLRRDRPALVELARTAVTRAR